MIDEHAEREAAAHRAQRQIAEKSLQQMHEEIADAEAVHQSTVDDWHAIYAKAQADLTNAKKPDADPQVEAVRAAGNLRHAAELAAGKILSASAAKRGAAIAAAEYRHRERTNQA